MRRLDVVFMYNNDINFFFQFLVFYMAFLHFYKVLFILLVAVSDRPFFSTRSNAANDESKDKRSLASSYSNFYSYLLISLRGHRMSSKRQLDPCLLPQTCKRYHT